MKTIKNLLSLGFLILITYSCEPEILPEPNQLIIDNLSAETGNQKDVKETGEDKNSLEKLFIFQKRMNNFFYSTKNLTLLFIVINFETFILFCDTLVTVFFVLQKGF